MTEYEQSAAEKADDDRGEDCRVERERDRAAERAPLPDKEPFVSITHTAPVFPRDLDDYPAALARVEALADEYASVEIDRLPPMGALHWLLRCHREDGSADTFRVGAHGSLMPWPVKP